jgi:2-polyprenyl-6-methoxyphenol hydroxylase-like FAD-dependent oxidoreductase
VLRVLISGAGIAGPTLAFWLNRYGFEPTIVETAPALRTGGYIIDFWGAGFDVAARMGLLQEIRDTGYMVREVKVVNRNGRKISGFSAEAFARSIGGRYVSLARGDLASTIFRSVEGKVEAIFGDSIRSLDQTDRSVRVEFLHQPAREFDLVIGADGLHSNVRGLAFGPESQFEKYLGFKVAGFTARDYSPRDELVYVMYTEVGQQITRFPMRDGSTVFLFTFADAGPSIPEGAAAQKALLRNKFGESGWECPRILEALDACKELYFDRVSQIRMAQRPTGWSRGRVALVGDAASCVSLLAGQGSSLAMVAAYILAGELRAARGDFQLGFTRYESLFRPFVEGKQKAALRFASAFAPKSKLALYLRNRIFDLMKISCVADLYAGSGLVDKIELRDY